MDEEANAQAVTTVQMVVKHQGSSSSERRLVNSQNGSNLVRSDELSNLDSEINQKAVIKGINYSSEDLPPISFRAPEDPLSALNADNNANGADEQERVSCAC